MRSGLVFAIHWSSLLLVLVQAGCGQARKDTSAQTKLEIVSEGVYSLAPGEPFVTRIMIPNSSLTEAASREQYRVVIVAKVVSGDPISIKTSTFHKIEGTDKPAEGPVAELSTKQPMKEIRLEGVLRVSANPASTFYYADIEVSLADNSVTPPSRADVDLRITKQFELAPL